MAYPVLSDLIAQKINDLFPLKEKVATVWNTAQKPLLLNKRFDSGGKSVVIRDFDLYGNGDKLVVKLQTAGSLDGVFYLTAKPLYNQQTGLFSVEDVDFDMQTRSVLLKLADWFLHGSIRGMIQEKLNMNLTEQLEKTRSMAGKALARYATFLKGDIKN